MLEFGTAGIRGIVGESDDKLNNAHAAMIFEALAKYINHTFKDIKNKSVVIGRDNRIKGKDFANIAAQILTSNGIKVIFNNQMLPTPFISFLVQHRKALAGINITASHNPKEYNGIKLYNQFGYQMLPNEIKELKIFFNDYETYKNMLNQKIKECKSDLIVDVTKADFDNYIKEVLSNSKHRDLSNIKIVYSSLHGTGYDYVKAIFNNIKSNIIFEPNECKEDENFSYVANPNPETEVAFINTIKLANKEQADLILITDPDSDRVGVAYRDNDGEFKLINGNENAILITDYLLNNKVIDASKENYLIYSFVSTSLPAKMCEAKNITSKVTETGFKWIGQKIKENQNNNFFFAFEESYGSLINEKISLDKDAIQGVYMIAVIASEAKRNNMNLNEKLDEIYQKYGYMKAKSFSFDLKNQEQLKELKTKFRALNFENSELLDYSQGIRGIEPNEMLCYEFKKSFNWISLRPSGTEPKFKIYIHIVEPTKIEAEEKFNHYYEVIKKMCI